MRKAPGNVYFITLSPAVFKHSLDFCSVCGVRLKIGVFKSRGYLVCRIDGWFSNIG